MDIYLHIVLGSLLITQEVYMGQVTVADADSSEFSSRRD